MAALVLLDASITLNAVNVSAFVSKVELKVSVEDQESTAFGSTYKSRLGGLKDGELALTFNNDFVDATGIDDIMWPLLGTVVAFVIKATSAATSASNPRYFGNLLVAEWNPLSGSVGDLATVDVSFPTTGTVTRADV